MDHHWMTLTDEELRDLLMEHMNNDPFALPLINCYIEGFRAGDHEWANPRINRILGLED
jgi:hypothetical protein